MAQIPSFVSHISKLRQQGWLMSGSPFLLSFWVEGLGGGGCWSDKFSLFWHKQNRWQFEMVCRIFEVLEGALKLFVWGTFIIGVLVYI